ncbi:hypothetical protein COY32_00040 [candidate division WWE3 bacterium CG_4_10_14_0_2_um_filter_41_14]|uniref:Uncharacterized protein n=1 Tax=candidate division WWE3 bacterium CG_4_10_14_0_2_um_filter_41_14 TaxID=1975072 RepID=A0A2M7TM77_UNCKA|nr:MAG: hypothetical protein COY32_00040 [candidate division WWE3 bacterium CG_4_10_14_0_2_um_filter_41_14]
MGKQNSGNIMIALLAVGLLIGVGAWYVITQRDVISPDPTPTVTPTPSETAIDTSDWKTYTNEEYRFSFKYPEYMELDFNRAGEQYRGTLLLEAHFEGPNNSADHFSDGMLFMFSTYPRTPENKDFFQHVTIDLIENDMYLDDTGPSILNETINGLNVVRVFGVPSGSTETTSFFIEGVDAIIYVDGFIRPQNMRDKYDAIFEKMIQTFSLK